MTSFPLTFFFAPTNLPFIYNSPPHPPLRLTPSPLPLLPLRSHSPSHPPPPSRPTHPSFSFGGPVVDLLFRQRLLSSLVPHHGHLMSQGVPLITVHQTVDLQPVHAHRLVRRQDDVIPLPGVHHHRVGCGRSDVIVRSYRSPAYTTTESAVGEVTSYNKHQSGRTVKSCCDEE